MTTLTTLPDLAQMLAGTYLRVQEHPIVASGTTDYPEAVLKFQAHGVSEVLGYQCASVLHVPVPRYRGFWSPEAVTVGHLRAGPGRIGILVEFLKGYRSISRDEASTLDPRGMAAILAFCVFDRHEWGECGLESGRLVFLDLERFSLGIVPESVVDLVADRGYMDRCLADYVHASQYMAEEALAEATRLGVMDLTLSNLRTLQAALAPDANGFFALDPHPLSRILEAATATACRERLQTALRCAAA